MVGRGDLDSVHVANSVINSYKDLKTTINSDNDNNEVAKYHIDSLTNLATCCCPIPGDLIIGVMTPGIGLEIHTTKCHILQSGNFIEKKSHLITHISWPERSNEYFSCALIIEVKNYQGAIADIAAKIARKKASILQINVQDAHNSHGSLYVLIDVLHRTHLAHIIKSLRNINSVYKVSRFFNSQKNTT